MKFIELRREFFSQFTPRLGEKEILQSGRDWIVGEVTISIDERWNFRMRQDASTDDSHNMNANGEAGIFFRELHRLFAIGCFFQPFN